MNNRLLFDVDLRPAQGSRFAPTGFPDLGAALFERPIDDGSWEECLLVESAQSMANRLEGTLWNDADDAPAEAIAALPYVRVIDPEGTYVTSSRTESHRLVSPYVRNARVGDETVRDLLVRRLDLVEDSPLDYRAMARTIFTLDPLVLAHGVFFAGKGGKEFPGQPKFARVVTGFIEASDVRRADSGGVKRDHVSHLQSASGGDSSEGFGSIPFARTEWTARRITASFNIDLAQVRSYALPDDAASLLVALTQLEIATLLAGSLRLRTNCDLEVASDAVASRDGQALPDVATLESRVSELIDRCLDAGLLGDGAITATWTKDNKKKGSGE
jgi:CRISPR-associated protein Csb1